VTSPRPRPLRLRAATGLALAGVLAALTLTGCSATNQITTEKEYNSSDGIGARLGDIKAINLLVVSAAKGEPGALLGALENTGGADQTVTIAIGSDSSTVRVASGKTVLLGAPGGNAEKDVDVTFDAIDEPPGAFVDLTLSTPDAGSTQVGVPVLDGSLPEYADSVPTPSPSS